MICWARNFNYPIITLGMSEIHIYIHTVTTEFSCLIVILIPWATRAPSAWTCPLAIIQSVSHSCASSSIPGIIRPWPGAGSPHQQTGSVTGDVDKRAGNRDPAWEGLDLTDSGTFYFSMNFTRLKALQQPQGTWGFRGSSGPEISGWPGPREVLKASSRRCLLTPPYVLGFTWAWSSVSEVLRKTWITLVFL